MSITYSDFFDMINTLPFGSVQTNQISKSNIIYYLMLTPNDKKVEKELPIDLNINNKIEAIEHYKFFEHIANGSYNQVYIVKDMTTGIKYAYRSNIDLIDDETHTIYGYIEHFIHWKLKDEPCILKPHRIFYNRKEKSVDAIFHLMDGTMGDILVNDNLPTNIKIDILISCLKSIIPALENLQKKYNFVHNDFKSNNVFFRFKKDKIYEPENLEWYIGDLDFTRIVINKRVIYGNYIYDRENSKNFNPRLDLFIFINSVYINLNNIIANKILWTKIKTEKPDKKSFQKLYTRTYENISELYEPKNFLELLKDF